MPETPSGLAEFEAIVMASAAPAVVLIDRALVRAWLRYTRKSSIRIPFPEKARAGVWGHSLALGQGQPFTARRTDRRA